MTTLTAVRVDLNNCDREPIHTPGAIQPHGCLLAFSVAGRTLTHWSANAAAWLGAAPTLGEPFEALLRPSRADEIEAILQSRPGILHPCVLTGVGGAEERFAAAVHHHDGSLIVELERPRPGPNPHAPVLASLPLRLNLANQRLQACLSIDSLNTAIAEEVRKISGFDRVMLYRFLEEGHGAVVGEAVDPRFESFLGLHYPATDIPQQARRLYELNPVRAIADILAEPVPLKGGPLSNGQLSKGQLSDGPTGGGGRLDLSFSCYRAVSPIHIEYLSNMGVRASMSISILHEGRLWGLIACHHYASRELGFEQRAACEMLGLMAGAYLTARHQEDHNRARSSRRAKLSRLVLGIAEADSFAEGVYAAAQRLCQVVAADGVAFCWQSGARGWGSIPPAGRLETAVQRCLDPIAGVTQTDRLGRVLGAELELGEVCGCLSVPLNSPDLTGLLFFRNEYAREVRWAGEPTKVATRDDDGVRLSPRKSFQAWRETVRNRSRPWSAVDREMAEEIRAGMGELLSRRAAHLARLNADLSAMIADLDSFAYAASHELREPLRGLSHTLDLLLEHLGESVSEEVAFRSAAMLRLTGRMGELVEGLLRLSRAGRGELSLEPVSLNDVARDALEMACSARQPAGVQLTVEDAQVTADYLCLRALLTNLISNAVKYNARPVKLIEIGISDKHEARAADGRLTPVVCVKDNGIGIAAEHHDDVFHIFRRLHPRDEYGGGTGAGLTIVKKIVQRHGGRVWLESTPGQGSAFYFTLEPCSL